MNQHLFSSVDHYIQDLLTVEDDALKAVARSIEEFNIPAISVTPNQGKFLHVLAKLNRCKKILEVGTLAGYSTIWMARALPPEGKLITLEFDPMHARVAQQNIDRAGLTSRVDIRVGMAIDLLPRIAAANEGPFDMIFIDADKPPYAEYFEWALRLAHPGTLIVADNVIREGKILDPDCTDERVTGVARFNALLSKTTGVTATIIQTVGAKEHDGMALIVVDSVESDT